MRLALQRSGPARPRARGRTRARLRGLHAIVAFGLLALAFAWAQQAASLHGLSHAVAAVAAVQPTSNPDAPDSGKGFVADHCDQCLLLAAFAAGAPAPGVTALPSAKPAAAPYRRAQPVRQRGPPSLGFRSRAPPILA